MFYVSDYNTFEHVYKLYLSTYDKNISSEECKDLFDMISEFAPCTINQFKKQLIKSMALYTAPLKVQDLMQLASFDGRTKEEAKAYAFKLWKILFTNRSREFDFCFADPRACISFTISFNCIKDFVNISDLEQNEKFYTKTFIDNYLNCAINDNLEIINAFQIQKGWQKTQIRKVVPIGHCEDVRTICDLFYGAGHWGFWRNDLCNRLQAFRQIDQREQAQEGLDLENERVALMQEVIDVLEGKKTNTNLLLK